MTALTALEQASSAMTDYVVAAGRAAWTLRASRPARLLDRFGALRFGAEAAEKFWNGHALLELDSLVGNERAPTWGAPRVRCQYLM